MPSNIRAEYPIGDCKRLAHGLRTRELQGINIYLGTSDTLIETNTEITITEARGLPMWVGTVESDLSKYSGSILEMRTTPGPEYFRLRFYVRGTRNGRTLIRGLQSVDELFAHPGPSAPSNSPVV